ncbi:hypothetical protein VTI28DRAFT_6567 [Corynascus sepedonium]
MAQEIDDEFSRLWQRHLTTLRDDFSASSVQALPSIPSGSPSFDGDAAPDKGPWDDKIDSVIDALGDPDLQSPRTADTHSPETPWFPEQEGYIETALSSPLNSSWPMTVGLSRNTEVPSVFVEDYSFLVDHKGKGVAERSPDQSTRPPHWNDGLSIPFLLKKQLLDDDHQTIDLVTTATRTAVAPSPTGTPDQSQPPSEVHALILTWETTTPADTQFLRATLKRRGYSVQCRTIPRDYPTVAVETILSRFLERSSSTSSLPTTTPAVAAAGSTTRKTSVAEGDSLLVVYYCGWGCLDAEGRMSFYR